MLHQTILNTTVAHRPSVPTEIVLQGSTLKLPLLDRIGAISSQSASRISWHQHDHYEMLFVLEGTTAYEFPKGRTLDLPGGHFLIIPPRIRHRGTHDTRTPATLCGLIFDPRRNAACRNTPFSKRDLQLIARQFDRHTLTVEPMGGDLRRLANSLNRLLRETPPDRSTPLDSTRLRWLVCGLLLEGARQLSGHALQPSNTAVTAALAYLQAHWNEAISVHDLTLAARCSRARLFDLFKHSTGMTPNDYLQRLRVQKARALLANPQCSITDIAYETGFSSSQYFSQVFRKYTGATPSQFRLKNK
jgi:AraC-like DNA-binding protein/quercetin dioxygenase-like cupin family protein